MSDNKSFKVQNGLDVTGDASVSGSVTATSFIGDGSQLTGISGGSGGGLDSDGVQSVFDHQQSIRLGQGATTQSSTGEVAVGYNADATGADAIAIGYDANATALFSLSLGRGSNATYEDAIAIGRSATSSQADTIAMGTSSAASGSRSVAIGNATDATATGAVAIGNTAQALSSYAIAIGSTADTNTNSYAVAIGSGTEVTGTQGVAIGRDAAASQAGVAAGPYASVTGTESTAIGVYAGATGTASLALGRGAKANANNTIALAATGSNSIVASQYGIDIRTSDSGSLTYSTDSDWVFGAPVTSSEFKFADGTSMTTAPTGGGGGLDSAAVIATMNEEFKITTGSRVEIGNGAATSGSGGTDFFNIAIGSSASAIGDAGVAIGRLSNIPNNVVNAVAVGIDTEVSANYGVALGDGATASGTSSIALGNEASARQVDMVVIGPGASGAANNSVIVGHDATASGPWAVVIGDQAEGVGGETVAIGNNTLGGAGRGVAIGDGANTASGTVQAIAIGNDASTIVSDAIAIGDNSSVTSQFGIDIRTSTAGSLTYDTTNDWTFGAGVTMTDLTASGATVVFNNLPTTDPVNAGQLWNDAGTLKVSAG